METISPDINIFGIYPEGEDGNCKPFWNAYHMDNWRIGFVRLAITRRAKVVPMAFIGGEECLPVASTIKILRPFIGSVMPMPLFALPLPSNWKIIFHKPIDFSSYKKSMAKDKAFCIEQAQKIQNMVQKTLDKETKNRPLVRFNKLIHKSFKIF